MISQEDTQPDRGSFVIPAEVMNAARVAVAVSPEIWNLAVKVASMNRAKATANESD